MFASPVKILVRHDSLPGTVEQMAKLIADGAREIQRVEGRLKKITGEGELKATPEDVLWADGLAVGTPTNMGAIPRRMTQFWDDEKARTG